MEGCYLYLLMQQIELGSERSARFKMLPQRLKKTIVDNPKKLATLVDLVNLPSTLREFVGQSQTSRLGCFIRVWSYIKENNLQVIVSGKLRAARAKTMKFKDGYMISSGQPVKEYIDASVRHVLLRQGVLGLKVKIMLDWHPKGKMGPPTPLPDIVIIHPPKEEESYISASVQVPTVPTEEIPIVIDPIVA